MEGWYSLAHLIYSQATALDSIDNQYKVVAVYLDGISDVDSYRFINGVHKLLNLVKFIFLTVWNRLLFDKSNKSELTAGYHTSPVPAIFGLMAFEQN